MNQRGFTIIEILVVFVLVAAMVGFAVPRIADRITKQSVTSARDAVATLHAKARAAAVQRGSATTLKRSGTHVLITTRHPVTGALDTIDRPQDVYDRWGGVTMTWTRDSLMFDARGLGQESSNTTVIFTRAGWADTLVVSSVGAILQ